MFTCTACRLSFTTPAEQKDHFRMDWHRYNLKRKVVELPPVTEEQFELRMQKVRQEKEAQAANDPKQKQRSKKEQIVKAGGVKTLFKCVPCNKTFTSANAHENHLASKKHVANAKKNPEVASVVETVEKQMDLVSLEDADAAEQGEGKEPKELTDEELAKELEEFKKQVPLEKEDCIFCLHHATDFDACLTHMLKEHGFFIPDVEFLVDAEGLIEYLAEKVKVGNYCLFCNGKGKAFRTYQDAQKHMTSLSHCKLHYEDEDLEELLEFYDFAAQYTSSKKSKAIAEEEVEWETDSEASIDSDEEVVEDAEGEEEEADEDTFEDEDTLNVSETGELVLASGRRLGRREFRRYYKQRFRPDEARESVLAATKENLLLAYQTAGVDPRGGSTALSNAFVANFMRKRNVSLSALPAAVPNNIGGGMSLVESKRKNFWHEKNRSRLDNRSHKLQKNPNRRTLVTV
ncbi:hypothetical protein BBJ28_00010744 [Nothophytophthora sp. Chile5]|nr:hypothetical protein BBJ28_00010744 [Nothophytophthora sp. Chile5]